MMASEKKQQRPGPTKVSRQLGGISLLALALIFQPCAISRAADADPYNAALEKKAAVLEPQAQSGDPSAQVKLGDLFLGGRSPEDDAKAIKWYRLAADQGSAEAQAKLGVIYFMGQGVEKDYKEALSWFGKAAQQGHAGARYHLGLMHAEGFGVPRNPEEARKWFEMVGGGDAAAAMSQSKVLPAKAPDQPGAAPAPPPANSAATPAATAQSPAAPVSPAVPAGGQGPLAEAAALFRSGQVDPAREVLKKATEQAVVKGDRAALPALDQALTDMAGALPPGLEKVMAALQSKNRMLDDEEIDSLSKVRTALDKARQAAEGNDWEQVSRQAATAVREGGRVLSGRHPAQMEATRLQGMAFFRLGRLDEAVAALEKSREVGAALLGAGHPETLSSGNLLAEVWESRLDFDKATALRLALQKESTSQLGAGHLMTLELARSLATLYSNRNHYDPAFKLLSETCAQMDRSLGAWHPQSLLCGLDRARVDLQRGGGQAVAEYRAVVSRMERRYGPSEGDLVEARLGLADALRRAGELQPARETATSVLKALEQDPHAEPDLRFRAMDQLAGIEEALGHLPEAEKLAGEVLAFEKDALGATHPNVVSSMTNLAGIKKKRGYSRDAETLFNQALVQARKGLGEKHQITITILNNLGLMLEEEGLYDQAEPLFRQAVQNAKALLGNEHPTTLAASNSLALLHESQGDFEKATAILAELVQISTKKNGESHPDTLSFLDNLAYMSLLQGDAAQAGNHFAKVYQGFEKVYGLKHTSTLTALNNLGRVARMQGQSGEAEQRLTQALNGRRELLGDKHRDVIRSMHDLGALWVDVKRFDQARDLLNKALETSDRALGQQHPYTFEIRNTLARLEREAGRPGEALKLSKETFQRRTRFLDRMMWVAGENAREGYVRLHTPELHAHLGLLRGLNSEQAGKELLEVSLQRKGLLFRIASEVQQVATFSGDAKMAALGKALQTARNNLASLTLTGPTAEDPAGFNKKLKELEEEVERVEGELGRQSLRFQQATRRATLDEVARKLPSGSALIDFVAVELEGKPALMAGVMTRDGDKTGYSFTVYPDLDAIRGMIKDFREIIQEEGVDEDDIFDKGMKLYRVLWKPLLAQVNGRKSLFVVPDDMLHILPFAALVDESDRYLITSHDIRILGSSRDLLPTPARREKGLSFLTMAGPDYDSDEMVDKAQVATLQGRRSSAVGQGMRAMSRGMRGLKFDPLPGAEQEGRLIAGFASEQKSATGQLFTRKQAQEATLKELKQPPGVLHVATHGFFLKSDDSLKKRLLKLQRGADLTQVPPPGDNPMLRSGLAFAGVNANAPYLGEIETFNDGVLTALEVLGLNLNGTNLAVLSACETGLGEIHEGEGVYGLRRAFQEAGVRNVISSLWEVSDAGTQALMTGLYKHLLAGKEVHEALRLAQLDMMKNPRWGYPYVWSAFMLVGR
ncbi:MAG: CHAT domain-containing protein [Magnetococcales bacterium]|nr:CHAT domain-containing protein [Magnetococcales bacterium]